jgi:putative hemolysin
MFFSGMEIAFTSFDRIVLAGWKKSGRVGIRALQYLTVKSDRFLMTTLIGNNLSNVAYATLIVIWAEEIGLSAVLVMIASPLFILVFGEILPKVLAHSSANRLVRIGAYPLFVAHILFSPFRWILRPLAYLSSRLPQSPKEKVDHTASLRLEIDQILSEAEAEGALNEREGELLLRYLNARDIRVREVMTPRTRMVAVEQKSTILEVIAILSKSRHDVLPVYYESLDNIVGCIRGRDLPEIIRPIDSVPESKHIVDMLEQFKSKDLRIAIVVDEHGGTDGIVTLKDIISALVGPVGEAWDAKRHTIKRLAPGKFLVTGSVDRDELDATVGWSFPQGDFLTLSGWMTDLLGGIPDSGEQVEIEGVIVRCLTSSPTQIEVCLISIPNLKDHPPSEE